MIIECHARLHQVRNGSSESDDAAKATFSSRTTGEGGFAPKDFLVFSIIAERLCHRALAGHKMKDVGSPIQALAHDECVVPLGLSWRQLVLLELILHFLIE